MDGTVQLAEPLWLWLLVLVPLPLLREARRDRLRWPTLGGFSRWGLGGVFRWVTPTLRALAIASLVVALARPRTVAGRTYIASKGVAIVVALDQSSSMATRDFPSGKSEPVSRLEAAKGTFAEFVQGRRDDLIGLVAFADYPDTACPPTLDHAFVVEAARAVGIAPADEDQTNLGDALAWSVRDVKATVSPKKVVVLLTDGQNQPGVPKPLDPVEAAALAGELGVIVHAVALGPTGEDGPDLGLLGEMVKQGHGRLFQATSPEALAGVFREIDRLERSPLTGTILTRYREWFGPWALAAGVALVLDGWLVHGRWRCLP